MKTTIGSLANRNKTTAKILFARTGVSDYSDLGNVIKFAHVPAVQRYAHMSSVTGDAGGGYKREDGNLIVSVSHKWKATLNEHTADTLRLLLLAAALTATNQATNATLAVAISGVKVGYSYWVGAYNITSAALTFATLTKTEGVDYVLDYASGILTILPGSTIVDSDAVAGTISVPAVKLNTFTHEKDLRATGAFQILEFDQFAAAPRKHHTFTGELWVSNWGEQTVEQPNEFEVEILAISKPVTKERNDS